MDCHICDEAIETAPSYDGSAEDANPEERHYVIQAAYATDEGFDLEGDPDDHNGRGIHARCLETAGLYYRLFRGDYA